MALEIGFAHKYYTVWNHTTSYRTDARGTSYCTDHYVFLRNASMSKEKALAKYPDAKFNEELRGRSQTWEREYRIIEYNKFHCGKYNGMLFAACTDYKYMMWFYNNCAKDVQKEGIKSVLISEGYALHTFNSGTDLEREEMISPEDVQAIKEQMEREEKGKARLAKGVPFVVTMEKNLNEFGEYFIRDLEITIRFENYKENYYQGFYYGLPLDKKGNAKRVKNKQLLIEKYEMLDETNALVKEWRFA